MANKTQYVLELLVGGKVSSSYYHNIESASQAIIGIRSTARNVAMAITAAFAAINITDNLTEALDTYSNFEKEVKNTSAIFSATREEQIRLEQAALEASKVTTTSSADAAEALSYMALAGWDVNTSISSLVPILKLAEATGQDTKTVSDLVTDSMSAMGVSTDKLTVYLDKLAAVNNNANTTATMAMETLLKSGGAAKALGANMDDLITAVGILANNGEKGTRAGTTLNSILNRLATNTNAKKGLDQLGVSIFDVNGKFIGLEETLRKINDATKDYSNEQKTAVLNLLAGTRQYSRFAYLLEGVSSGTEDGADSWNKLEKEIAKSGGSLEQFYKVETDTVVAAQARMSNAVENLKIDVVDTFSDEIKDGVNWVASVIPDISDKIEDFATKNEQKIVRFGKNAYASLQNLWKIVKPIGEFALDHFDTIKNSVTALIAVSFGASTITKIVGFISALNPVSATILGITAAVEVGTIAVSEYNKHIEDLARTNLEEHFGNVDLTLQDMERISAKLINNGNGKKFSKLFEIDEKVVDDWENLKDSFDEINRIDFLLGYKPTKKNQQDYIKNVQGYLDNIQTYLDDTNYQLHVSASLLFGKDSEQVNSYDDTYTFLNNTMQGLIDQTNDYITEALEDGILSESEQDIIANKYLSMINSITERVAKAQEKANWDALSIKYDNEVLSIDSFEGLVEEINAKLEEDNNLTYEALQNTLSAAAYKYGAGTEGYKKAYDEAQLAYMDAISASSVNAAEFMLDQVNKAYPEIQEALNSVDFELPEIYKDQALYQIQNGNNERALEIINSGIEQVADTFTSVIDGKGLRQPLSQLYTTLEPTLNELKKEAEDYSSNGVPIPDNVASAILQLEQIGLLSGNLDSTTISAETTKDIAGDIKDDTYWIKDYLSIIATSGVKINNAWGYQFNEDTGGSYTAQEMLKRVQGHANGGFVSGRQLSWVGENGTEAIIPMNNSERAKGLWSKAGEILGMPSGSQPVLNYNPMITIQGNANRDDVESALTISYEKLKAMINEISLENNRTSFAY